MATYTYKDGYISFDGMCIAQVVGQAQHIKAMIAKANAAQPEQEPEANADAERDSDDIDDDAEERAYWLARAALAKAKGEA